MKPTERMEEQKAKEAYVRGLLDDIIDYDYHIRLWDFTPQGKLLLCRNSFSGNCTLKADGFNLINPFAKGRHIDIREGYRDLPKLTFETADRIQTTVDPAIGLKIIVVYDSNGNIDLKETLKNILNLIKNSKNIYEHIYFTISNDLMALFKALSLDDVIGLNIERDSDMDEIQSMYEKLDTIKEYGIEITQFKKKSVNYSDEVKQARMSLEITNKRNEAILASAKTKVEVTKREAEAKKILAEAEAKAQYIKAMKENQIKVDLIKKFAKNGILDEAGILKLLEIMAVSGNDNAKVIATLGDSGLASTVAQLSAIYNQVKQDDENPEQKILVPNSNKTNK